MKDYITPIIVFLTAIATHLITRWWERRRQKADLYHRVIEMYSELAVEHLELQKKLIDMSARVAEMESEIKRLKAENHRLNVNMELLKTTENAKTTATD